MKLLVIGSGGREHAMAWKLAQSPRVQKVYVAPGNAGTALEPGLENVALSAIPDLISFAKENNVQLTVVGPEAPLAAGVVVAGTREEAHAAIDMMLTDRRLGASGSRVVIEEFLEGEEASFIVMSDGAHVLTLATSQDHKRLRDGDAGPNTGGMGAYSPAPVVTPKVHSRVMREIILPAVQGMAKEGMPYTGFLYAGLMIDQAGNPKTLEFNCRLGDPEAQPILVRLKSDLFELLEHALAGTLDRAEADWDRRSALGVVLAAHGYPEQPRKGDRIEGLPRPADDYRVFHAGTRLEGKSVLTNGGRVLCVTALGDSVKMARSRAYDAVERIRFDGMQYRKDIGHRALKKNP